MAYSTEEAAVRAAVAGLHETTTQRWVVEEAWTGDMQLQNSHPSDSPEALSESLHLHTSTATAGEECTMPERAKQTRSSPSPDPGQKWESLPYLSQTSGPSLSASLAPDSSPVPASVPATVKATVTATVTVTVASTATSAVTVTATVISTVTVSVDAASASTSTVTATVTVTVDVSGRGDSGVAPVSPSSAATPAPAPAPSPAPSPAAAAPSPSSAPSLPASSVPLLPSTDSPPLSHSEAVVSSAEAPAAVVLGVPLVLRAKERAVRWDEAGRNNREYTEVALEKGHHTSMIPHRLVLFLM